MLIRPATVDDAAAISALIHRNLAQLTFDPSGAGAERFLEFVTPQAIRRYIELPSFRYVVSIADDNGSMAGVVATRNGGHLYHLFVQPELQRQGLGRQLWTHAWQYLFDAGASKLTVNASVNAVPVYAAFGFVVCGERVEQNGVAFIPMLTTLVQGKTEPIQTWLVEARAGADNAEQ